MVEVSPVCWLQQKSLRAAFTRTHDSRVDACGFGMLQLHAKADHEPYRGKLVRWQSKVCGVVVRGGDVTHIALWGPPTLLDE